MSMQLRSVVNHAKKQCNIMLNHTTRGTRCLVASISLTDIFIMALCNRRWAFLAFSTWKHTTFPSLVFWPCLGSCLQKKAECLWEYQTNNTTTCNVFRLSQQDFKERSKIANHWPAVNQVQKYNRKSLRLKTRIDVNFRCVRKIAKSDYKLHHVWLPVRLSIFAHGTTRLPLDGFSWNVMFECF